MAVVESFDDMNMTELDYSYDLKPFQHRDDKSKKGTLDWLQENIEVNSNAKQSRMEMYRRMSSLYKGKNYRSSITGDSMRRTPRISVNMIYEMIEARVSQTSRFRTNVSLIPNNNEPDDLNNAVSCKKLLDNRAYEIDLEGKHIKADRILFKYGHIFIFVLWDKEAGGYHPAYEDLKKQFPDAKELEKILKKHGIYNLKVGDVVVKVISPDRVTPEFGKENFEDIDHIEYFEYEHIDHVKAMYPNLANDIQEDDSSSFSNELADYDRKDQWIMVRHFYHRRTKFLPEGAYIKYVNGCILEDTEYPYNEDCLPCVMEKDIDIDGEFWGRSFCTQIEQLQRFSNNLWSSVARDYSLASAAKWVMPKGAAKHSQLNNDLSILEYVGPQAPQLVRNTPTSPQLFEIQDRIDSKTSKLSRIYDISRGEPPKGITANSALRFLDEQEQQTIFPVMQSRNKRVINVYKMMICRMAQFYTKDDGRTLKTLGEDNAYMIESLKNADFTNIYDVKLLNSTALPDTKSGKISAIVDLNIATQTDPIFKKEEIIQMLDLALDDTFKSEATIAVTAAKTILDKILKGEPVPEPKVYDNLLVHYSIFMRAIQENSFKSRSPEVQAAMEVRLTVIEGMMWEKAQKNQAFAQKLMTVDTFPCFFNLPAKPPVQEIPTNPTEEIDTSNIKSIPNQQGGQDGGE